MRSHLINLMKFQIHDAKEVKQISYCVIIYVNISKHCICVYHKACSITPSNGACNNKKNNVSVECSAWVQSQVYVTFSSAKWRVQTMKAVGVTVHYGLYQLYTILTLPLSRNNLQGSKWSSDGAQLNDDTNSPWHAHLLGFLFARTCLLYQEMAFLYSSQDDTCLYLFVCVCVCI
jgi:hypothetical protein